MDDDAVNGLPLACVAGHGVAVVEVRVLAEVEVDGFPGFQAEAEVSAGIDLLNVPKLSVGDVLILERRRELDSVALGKLPLFPVIDIDTLKPFRIVGDLLAGIAADRQEVLAFIDPDDSGIFTLFDSLSGCCPAYNESRRPGRTGPPTPGRLLSIRAGLRGSSERGPGCQFSLVPEGIHGYGG